MNKIGARLSYANVMSTIAVFLVLGGATAFAAHELGRRSVGSKQLKANAVTTAKIKKEAVARKKIKKNAIDTTKIADGVVTGAKIADASIIGADINGPSTAFSQAVARLRGTSQMSFTPAQDYPLSNSTYTQAAGEDDQILGSVDVAFAASCVQPRAVIAYLLVDPEKPSPPAISEIAGYGTLSDSGSGAVTKRMEFVPLTGGTGLSRTAPVSATNHKFTIYLASASCSSGSGITATGASIDVIGTK